MMAFNREAVDRSIPSKSDPLSPFTSQLLHILEVEVEVEPEVELEVELPSEEEEAAVGEGEGLLGHKCWSVKRSASCINRLVSSRQRSGCSLLLTREFRIDIASCLSLDAMLRSTLEHLHNRADSCASLSRF